MESCREIPSNRKRIFWSTQNCEAEDGPCFTVCAIPGLERVDSAQGSTIKNENWIRGLILNILNTDKRVPASLCGVNPASVKGHWSESFINGDSRIFGGAQNGYRVGTSIRQIDLRKYRTEELVSLLETSIKTDLQKIVQLGLAVSIEVKVSYAGSRTFSAEVEVYGPSSPAARVSLSAKPNADMGFYWSV